MVAVEDFSDENREDLDMSNECLSQKMVEAQANHNEQDAKAIEDQVNASYKQCMFSNTVGYPAASQPYNEFT